MSLIRVLIIFAASILLVASTQFVNRWFDDMNEELEEYNRRAAAATWTGMIGEDPGDVFQLALWRLEWRERKCREEMSGRYLDSVHQRMIYLLCRGPRYTPETLRLSLGLRGQLQEAYEGVVFCKPGTSDHSECLRAEPGLDLLMRNSKDPQERLTAWTALRDALGPPLKSTYRQLIQAENQAARAAGYDDIGECWREELETPWLTKLVEDLYEQVAPLYRLLHAFVRHRLGQYYGQREVPPDGPIPAHLLGNMWSSSWESLMDVIAPSALDLDSAVRKVFPTARAMLESSDDFYSSLGLPQMSRAFWANSRYTENGTSKVVTCHGTAANMFRPGDERMILCMRINWEDFYVVHHEMGHIQYFMAYENQPAIFQDAANSALQETVGDTIMLAVTSPNHLDRVGILKNASAGKLSPETEMSLLLMLALTKIPQLAYGLIVDKWRWDVMASKVGYDDYNQLWWKYRYDYQGVRPAKMRNSSDLDPMSKFHVADSTPYVRYFLSGFLQFQLLDVLCENEKDGTQPLHRCDLYGNKIAGQRLRQLMEKGAEEPWNVALSKFSTGRYQTVTAEPLLRFFSPLKNYLEQEIASQGIPVGW